MYLTLIPAIFARVRRIGCREITVGVLVISLTLVATACGSSGSEAGPGATADFTPSPTPAPRDTDAAITALGSFSNAVKEERLDDAWTLYAASVPGTTTEHREDRGCDFNTFSFEFPSMTHLFQQIAPLEVVETFGSALGLSVVELRVRSSNGTEYLATLARGEPYSQSYQMMFLNSGNPAAVPGAPDPLPSPEFPQGFCGIWTGAR